jgi:hypothetical protein
MLRTVSMIVLFTLSGVAGEAAAQRRERPQAPGQAVAITIAGKIGGKKYQDSGSGVCRHAPDASIRDVSASLWMVQYTSSGEGQLKQVNLTLWRPKDGASDQLSLDVETKSGTHRVKTGGEGKNQGEGAVDIQPNGPGGRFEISGKDAAGKRIQITIDCPVFAGVEAEGG